MPELDAAYDRLKVLIIDDDQDARWVANRMLIRLGVSTIQEAPDAVVGFTELLRMRPDVVLCDVHMDPVNGQKFLERVRSAELDWVRAMPVIFLTSDNMLDTVRRAMQSHVDGFMVKPLDRDELKKHLDIVITRLAEKQGQEK